MHLPQLRRIRWAVRATLTLGVAASVVANILHARHNPISQAIAAWPPLALLLTVELTSRIPMHKRSLAATRVLSTVAIAGIAAWVSYWHMQDVAVRYGETTSSAYLLPISVDGLIVVASVSLVELAGRIRSLEESAMASAAIVPASQHLAAPPPVPDPAPAPMRTAERSSTASFGVGTASLEAALADSAPRRDDPTYPTLPAPVSPAVAPIHQLATTQPLTPTRPASQPIRRVTTPVGSANSHGSAGRPVSTTRAAVSTPARTVVTASAAPVAAADSTDSEELGLPRQRRPLQETAELADAIEAMNPGISPTELARQLGISPTRLRAVRREAREAREARGVGRITATS